VINLECKTAKKALNSLEPGQISDDRELMEHISSCPECSVQYAFIKKMDQAMAKDSGIPLSAGFESDVWKRISIKQTAADKPLWRPAFTWAAAAAVACLAFFAVITKYSGAQPAQTTAAVETAPIKAVLAKKDAVKPAIAANSPEKAVMPEKPEAVAVVAGAEPVIRENTADSGGNRRILSQDILGGGKAEKPAVYNQEEAVLLEKTDKYTAASVSGEMTKTYAKETAPEGNVEVLGTIIRPLNNESSVIKYKVSEAGYVVISIYDRSGKTVRRLFSGQSQTGTYSISWNGMDDSGRAAAAGIYVLFVKTGSYESKSKIGIIK
jgi:hypothetical protein